MPAYKNKKMSSGLHLSKHIKQSYKFYTERVLEQLAFWIRLIPN